MERDWGRRKKKNRKQMAKNLMTSYCYVMANNMFNKLGSKEFYQKQQWNKVSKKNFRDHGYRVIWITKNENKNRKDISIFSELWIKITQVNCGKWSRKLDFIYGVSSTH